MRTVGHGNESTIINFEGKNLEVLHGHGEDPLWVAENIPTRKKPNTNADLDFSRIIRSREEVEQYIYNSTIEFFDDMNHMDDGKHFYEKYKLKMISSLRDVLPFGVHVKDVRISKYAEPIELQYNGMIHRSPGRTTWKVDIDFTDNQTIHVEI